MQIFTDDRFALTGALINANLQILRQAAEVVRELDGAAYSGPTPGVPGLRIGPHLRHVIEFYDCFLRGRPSGFVNYDERRRELLLEQDRAAALAAVRGIMAGLSALRRVSPDSELWTAVEDAPDGVPQWMRSSLAREMQVLASHAVHHLALVAIALRASGLDCPADLGYAPSTLHYQEQLRRAAAQTADAA